MKSKYPSVSVIVATLNNAGTLRRTLDGLLKVRYPGKYDIVVVNDGSTDNTKEMLDSDFSGIRKIKIIHIPHSGVCVARNTGIRESRGEVVVNMDHDCIPERDWLSRIVEGFDGDVGVVSSYGYYGGTSTAFRRRDLELVGGYDEDYVYYREDTDLSFKIMEMGYRFKIVDARYKHDHEVVKPRGARAAVRYAIQRWEYHKNDVLLFKKHPRLAGNFLDVKFGFIVNPMKDFSAATGLWRGEYRLSSPRGIVFMENRSPIHSAAILLVGVAYVVGVKLFRVKGSIKFRKLLI